MEVQGTLLMRYRNRDSKSEGWYTYLLTNDLQLYQLYRPENFPINDSFFYDFDRKDVVITGELSDDKKYLSVESLVKTNEVAPKKEQENEETL